MQSPPRWGNIARMMTNETPRPTSPEAGERASGGVVVDRSKTPEPTETVGSPAKVMRIGAMVRQLLEEVRHAQLDEAGRARLAEIYEVSVRELSDALSPDLAAELDRITLPLESEAPSEAELRVAQAQLVGWLEGLFHGIQAAIFAQQVAAQNQLAQMRGRGLPGARSERPEPPVTGQYL